MTIGIVVTDDHDVVLTTFDLDEYVYDAEAVVAYESGLVVSGSGE